MPDVISLLLFSASVLMGLYFDPEPPEQASDDPAEPEPDIVPVDTILAADPPMSGQNEDEPRPVQDDLAFPADAPTPPNVEDDPAEPTPPEEEPDPFVGTEDDDRIDLAGDPANGGAPFDDITVRTFGGNDDIRILATRSEIFGGDGDDSIDISADDEPFGSGAAGSKIYGGAGNDTLAATSFFSDTVEIFGGEGDDTIDGRRLDNAKLFGGDGNDIILTRQNNDGGAGYVVVTDGGAGQDRLIFDGRAADGARFQPATLTGGSGSDTFELRFDEIPSESTSPPEAGDTLDLPIIGDFEPGVDRIEVEARTANDAYEVSSARLEEDATEGTTRLILSYTAADEPDLDLVVTINATGVTFDDITFLGTAPTTIVT